MALIIFLSHHFPLAPLSLTLSREEDVYDLQSPVTEARVLNGESQHVL